MLRGSSGGGGPDGRRPRRARPAKGRRGNAHPVLHRGEPRRIHRHRGPLARVAVPARGHQRHRLPGIHRAGRRARHGFLDLRVDVAARREARRGFRRRTLAVRAAGVGVLEPPLAADRRRRHPLRPRRRPPGARGDARGRRWRERLDRRRRRARRPVPRRRAARRDHRAGRFRDAGFRSTAASAANRISADDAHRRAEDRPGIRGTALRPAQSHASP